VSWQRSIPWAVAFVALVAFGFGCGGAARAPQSAVLIVVDTLRADHLGVYGYERETSPGIDRWAQRGALFEHAFAVSPWTLPSLASIYTGLGPAEHAAGQIRDRRAAQREYGRLGASSRTLAEIATDAGMQTAAIVNNPWLAAEFGVAQGFASYDYDASTGARTRRADVVVQRALDWISQRKDEPFFLVVHLMDPHMPYDPPQGVRGRFSEGLGSERELPVFDLLDLRANGAELPPADRKFVIAAYDEEVAFVDTQVDRLLTKLERDGRLAETLVVLTADHGEELFEHGGFEHGHQVYQELLHVPLIFWGPGVRGGRVGEAVSQLDVMPTLVEALGLPSAAHSGVSLWPRLTGQAGPGSRSIVAEGPLYGPSRSALVRWPWKLIATAGEAPKLFDLASDAEELHDRAAAQPERVRELREVLNAREGARGSHSDAAISEDSRQRLRTLGYIE
jgi:arylsulfatase A-like enzyme